MFLKDNGVRDEHGMQPLDDLFSSPEKENRRVVEVEKENLRVIEDDSEESDEEEIEMDIDESMHAKPGPPGFRALKLTRLFSKLLVPHRLLS